MDGRGFDQLTRRFGARVSRRTLLRGALAGGATLATVGTGRALAQPQDKVSICHYEKDSGTYALISVNGNAYDAHMAHGDYDPYDCDGVLSCNECEPVSSCLDTPQWTPVTCTTTQWVWSSNSAVSTDLYSANAAGVLQVGDQHYGVDTMCSLDGTGWVSTASFIMSGCDSSWWHIGGSYTGRCGGHDGDTYRHLALGVNDCYSYKRGDRTGAGECRPSFAFEVSGRRTS